MEGVPPVSGIRLFWLGFNFVLAIAMIALPIWLVIKVNSIDRNLKELVKKMNKIGDGNNK